MDARPGGPAAKRQPSPEGLGNRSRRGSERRRRGTQPIVRSPCVIRSVPGFPTSQLSPVPLMWFSSKRTACSCSKPQPSTGNPGKPRDLRFRGPFVEMFFDRAQRSGDISGLFCLPRTDSYSPCSKTLKRRSSSNCWRAFSLASSNDAHAPMAFSLPSWLRQAARGRV
jgi:hypothetical protein